MTAHGATLAVGAQGGSGIRGPQTAAPGSTITIGVGPNDPSIEVVDTATGQSTAFPVTPGKDTQVPVPNVPSGTILHIRVGKGLRRRILVVEVVTTGP